MRRIVCGEEHTVALGAGGAWAWGCGRFGQLGTGGAATATQPVPMPLARQLGLGEGRWGERLASLHCGCSHTVLALTDGRVATFGRGSEGQLGAGDMEDHPTPRFLTLGAAGAAA